MFRICIPNMKTVPCENQIDHKAIMMIVSCEIVMFLSDCKIAKMFRSPVVCVHFILHIKKTI